RNEHTRKRVETAHSWFERYGTQVVFFTRMLPVIRTFISLPAGVARMPIVRFSVLTFAGCLPWCLLLVGIGDAAGANWDTWHRRVGYLDYVVVLALVALAGWWLLVPRPQAPA